MSLNICTFSGRLGRDAEQKHLPSGAPVLEFSIAIDSGFGDKKTSWWLRCSMFGDRGPKLAQYLTKGQQIGVSGEFTPRTYQSNGQEKMSLDLRVNAVELLGSKRDSESAAPSYAPAPQTAQRQQARPAPQPFDDGDDIPF